MKGSALGKKEKIDSFFFETILGVWITAFLNILSNL